MIRKANNKIILESLSMDLLRVALGINSGSYKMADRFSQEALARKNEVDLSTLSPYVKNLLIKIEQALKNQDKNKKAEDVLMYSTLVRNYAQTKLK